MKDLHHALKFKRAISPDEGAANNDAKVSQIIDRQGYESLEFVIATGTIGDAGATFTVLVEHADEVGFNVTNEAVADRYLLGTEALASFDQDDDDSVFTIGYIGPKRFVRLTITPANNATAWDIGAIAVLGSPNDAPVS